MDRRGSKDKQLDIGWQHGRAVANNPKHVKCNYCGKTMHGGVSRLKDHLAGIAGDVQTCKEVPNEVKKEIKAYIFEKRKEKQMKKFEKQKMEEELMSTPRNVNSDSDDEEVQEDAELRRVMRASRQSYMEEEMMASNKRIGAGSSRPTTFPRSQSVSHVDPFSLKKQGRTQSTIKAAMKGIKDVKKHVGRAFAKFMFYNHIPHNVVNSPYYQPMFDAIADAGRGVPPPTAWELSNTYLDLEHAETKAYLETFHSHWDEYGCTLMCDGWSTQNRRKIINFLVYSTYGTVFLDSIDATDKFQNGPYIFDLMDKMIDLIGEHRVVQVITDNGSNYKAAGQLLMQKRQHLYWTPCAAHCIDLIFLDMSKDEDVQNIISESQRVTGFIYNHSWVLSLMRKETNGKELVRPAITRFATHFIALDSIYAQRENLRRMITSRAWQENFPKLKPKDKKTATDVYNLIHSDEFWTQIFNVIIVFEPLVKVLRMVDSDDKAEMGYLYEAMDRAKEEIKKNLSKGYRKWWNIIDKRWDRQLHQHIHAAGYFLNPRFQFSNTAINDYEILSGFKHVIERLEPDIGKQLDIHREAELYRMKVGTFNSEKARLAAKRVTPAEWWSIIAREQAPNLTRLAVRILSQTVSSSNCERNWTTFSLIHTKPRNRLTMENLKKLVFVHYNMRLRERHWKRKTNDDQLIDLDQMFHEDDPLVEWTREVEDRLLDDRDNPWLDDALTESETTRSNQPRPRQEQGRRSDKRKKEVIQEREDDDSSSDDQSPTSGGGASGSMHSYHPAHDTGHRATEKTYSRRYREHVEQQEREEQTNDPPRGQYDYGHRHSDFYGGYTSFGIQEPYTSGYFDSHGGYFVPSDHYPDHARHSIHSPYSGDYSSSYGSHHTPAFEESRPSAYDNMMTAFLGPDQMQYSYPPYYYSAQSEDANIE